MQHGIYAFEDTVKSLSRNEITAVGLLNENRVGCKPVIKKIKGLNVGMLGYAFEKEKYNSKDIKYAYEPMCSVKNDIESIRKKVDVLIISCHWGLEFIKRPSVNTVRYGRKLIDYGADVILGHHPHVLQGYEKYKKGVIIYSMGNFLFDMLWDKKLRESAIFEITINGDKIGINTIPIYIDKKYRIKVVKGIEADIKRERIKNVSKEISHSNKGDIERNLLRYYLEYEKLRKRNRYKSYIYFLKNGYKIKVSMLYSIILNHLKRNINVLTKK
jgi:poly-gamma-glutamate synthesis protein (capsule biosynthesis protein)